MADILIEGKNIGTYNAFVENMEQIRIDVKLLPSYSINYEACLLIYDLKQFARNTILQQSGLPRFLCELFNFYSFTKKYDDPTTFTIFKQKIFMISPLRIYIIGIIKKKMKRELKVKDFYKSTNFRGIFFAYMDVNENKLKIVKDTGNFDNIYTIIKEMNEEAMQLHAQSFQTLRMNYDERQMKFVLTGKVDTYYDSINIIKYHTIGRPYKIKFSCVSYDHKAVHISLDGSIKEEYKVKLSSDSYLLTDEDTTIIVFYFNGIAFKAFFAQKGKLGELKTEKVTYSKILDFFIKTKPEICGNEVKIYINVIRRIKGSKRPEYHPGSVKSSQETDIELYEFVKIPKRIPRNVYEKLMDTQVLVKKIGRIMKFSTGLFESDKEENEHENRETRILRKELAEIGVDLLSITTSIEEHNKTWRKLQDIIPPDFLQEIRFSDFDGIGYFIIVDLNINVNKANALLAYKLKVAYKDSLPLIMREKHVRIGKNEPEIGYRALLKNAYYKMGFRGKTGQEPEEYLENLVTDEVLDQFKIWVDKNKEKYITERTALSFVNRFESKQSVNVIGIEKLEEPMLKKDGAIRIIEAIKILEQEIKTNEIPENVLYNKLKMDYFMSIPDLFLNIAIDKKLIEKKRAIVQDLQAIVYSLTPLGRNIKFTYGKK